MLFLMRPVRWFLTRSLTRYRNVDVVFCVAGASANTIRDWFATYECSIFVYAMHRKASYMYIFFSYLFQKRFHFNGNFICRVCTICAYIHYWSYGFPQRCGRLLCRTFLLLCVQCFFFLLSLSSLCMELCAFIFSKKYCVYVLFCSHRWVVRCYFCHIQTMHRTY